MQLFWGQTIICFFATDSKDIFLTMDRGKSGFKNIFFTLYWVLDDPLLCTHAHILLPIEDMTKKFSGNHLGTVLIYFIVMLKFSSKPQGP